MTDLISDRVSFLICLINNFSVTCFCPILQKFNNGTGSTRFKYPLEVLFEILSFLTVDQLFKINSANWSLYRVSQLIYEPIPRRNPPRHLKRMRGVTHEWCHSYNLFVQNLFSNTPISSSRKMSANSKDRSATATDDYS